MNPFKKVDPYHHEEKVAKFRYETGLNFYDIGAAPGFILFNFSKEEIIELISIVNNEKNGTYIIEFRGNRIFLTKENFKIDLFSRNDALKSFEKGFVEKLESQLKGENKSQ